MTRVWYRLIWSAAVLECVAAAGLVVYVCLRAKPAAAIEPRATEAIVAQQQINEPIVCTMRNDSYYHRRSCRYLSSSKIAMPLTRAQLHHRPCNRCKPAH